MQNALKRAALITALGLVPCAPLIAAPCEITPGSYDVDVAKSLEGRWTMLSGPGVSAMKIGEMVMDMPLPSGMSQTLALLVEGDQLTAQFALLGPQALLPRTGEERIDGLSAEAAGRTDLEAGETVYIDRAALPDGLDCPLDEVLRLGFTATLPPAPGQTPEPHSLELYILDYGHMSGVLLIGDGGEKPMRRLVTFTKD